MAGGVTIQVNGEPHTVAAEATLRRLLAERDPRPPFAVEVNKRLVKRDAYDATVLRDGDRVEIVTLVGGG